jgi:hypothetical protein
VYNNLWHRERNPHENPWVVVGITVAALVVLKLLLFLALSGGNTARIGEAIAIFFRVLRDPAAAEKVKTARPAPPPPPPGPPKPSGVPLRILGTLQREARLLDFLMEDIQAYGDADIGAGVRDIHRRSQKLLKDQLILEPVMAQEEETTVEVPASFDPSAVRLTGNVTGSGPYRGTLKHKGWRVKEVKLAARRRGRTN